MSIVWYTLVDAFDSGLMLLFIVSFMLLQSNNIFWIGIVVRPYGFRVNENVFEVCSCCSFKVFWGGMSRALPLDVCTRNAVVACVVDCIIDGGGIIGGSGCCWALVKSAYLTNEFCPTKREFVAYVWFISGDSAICSWDKSIEFW